MSILQAVLTALLSGLFSGAILFALNERRDRQRLLLEKSEEAVMCFMRYSELLSSWPGTYYEMFGEDRKSGRKASEIAWNETRQEFLKARLLVGIYIPQHIEDLRELQKLIIPILEKGQK